MIPLEKSSAPIFCVNVSFTVQWDKRWVVPLKKHPFFFGNILRSENNLYLCTPNRGGKSGEGAGRKVKRGGKAAGTGLKAVCASRPEGGSPRANVL